ncbi:YitT family protein [Anaerococcus murdochii]|uniref:YitT family protein n=1 Tax=Anaerococcus murdochii TaxID=411577 RepID=A0ABS7T0P3_9FIRM|nr:YitT family protein [Anaerococcus murdochii]MBZ2387357.1 YitT family protein [Anaerococcus murdochii]
MKKYLWILFGSFLIAGGLYFFLLSQDIAAGGISGFALVVSKGLPFINLGMVNLLLNVIVLIAGMVFIGFDFAKKSLISSLAVSAYILVFEKIVPNVSLGNDKIINIIFGSTIVSLGLAIVFNHEASSGGTDLIAAIFNKYFNVPLHVCLFFADFVVVVSSAFIIGIDLAMYATLAIMIQSIGFDYFMQGFGRKISIMVISDKYREINEMLVNKHEKGVTLIEAEGGYSHNEKKVVMTITSVRTFPAIKDDILQIDDRAFVFTYTISEVLGEGFTYNQLD